MSGTVMKFGPQWIRTLTDGAAPASASSSSIATTTSSNNNNPQNSSNIINSNNSQSTSSTSSAASNYNNNINNNNNNNNINPSSNPSSFNSSSTLSNSNGGGCGTNSASAGSSCAAGKYKLAEYRYGREEMLALFEHDMEAPDEIRKYSDLFVENARMPMAMTQMSEEEVKLSTGKWNSDAVLRNSSKLAAASTATGAIPAGSSGGSTISDRDNRLTSERGALTAAEVLSSSPRGPPGSLSRIPLEQRGLLSSLSSRGHPSTIRNLVGRGPNLYSRSQSHDDDNPGDGIGGSSGSTGSGGGFENRFGMSGQSRQPNSLRARFETSRASSGLQSSKPIDIKPGIDGETSSERRSVFDRLPNKYNVDDKLVRKDLNGRPIQSDWRSRDWSGNGENRLPKPPPEERSWRSSRTGGAGTAEDWRSASNSNSNSSSWYVRSDDPRNARSQAPQNQENLNPNYSGKRDTLRRPSAGDKHGDDEEDIVSQPRHRRDSLPEWSIGDPLSGDKVGSFDASGAFREIATTEDGNNQSNSLNNKEKQKQQQQQTQQQAQQKRQLQREQQPQSHDFEHLERAAEIMVDEWTAEEEQHERNSSSSKLLNSKSNYSLKEQHDAQTNILQNNSEIRPLNQNQAQQQQHQQQHQQRQDHHQQSNSDQASSLAGNTTAFESSNQQQKFILLPFNHEDSQQWFYRDTQGVIQGPFSETEMFEWYKAGYFVKELLVRRACDELFYPLGDVMKMWDRIPFAPIPVNLPPPPPITAQTILQLNAVTKHQIEMAASLSAPSQGRIPTNAYEIAHSATVLLHGSMIQQQQQQQPQAQQQVHPVLAAATLNQHAPAPQDQQSNIRQIIEAATRHQQQLESNLAHQQQQPRAVPVNVLEQNEMQTQLRQLLAQLKNREGFSNLNAQEQQEVLRQYVAFRALPQGAAGLSEQELLRQRAQMMPFSPNFLTNDQQERLRIQQEIDRRMIEEAEKHHQQRLLMIEQRLKAEEEKQRLMDEVQQQRQRKQNEENEKQKQEADKERILKLSQLKQQQLAKQQEEFRQQMQNQQRIQQQQQQEKEKKQQQQQQVIKLNTIQQQQQQQHQQQQQQIERAKKAAQAQQVQQERKNAWSTVSKADQEPVSLATLQKLQEEEKERERQRQMQQQIQANQQHQQQQQQLQLQRQMTWANAAQQPKVAPIKTLAEIQKEEEERLAREKQRKAKVQPAVASSGVWNNAASHLSWKNPPADS